jgi:hypothetical protein
VAINAKIDYEMLDWHDDLLYDISDMIRRREVYFHVFHNGMELGELNKGCLWAFWILKLCPFKDMLRENTYINATMALGLFLLSIRLYVTAENKKYATGRKMINITPKRTKYLLHAFKYRDLSKESLMAIAESLIDGNPREENGMCEGELKSCYDNGKVKTIINYKDKKRDGKAEKYYENGQLEEAGNYSDDEKVGEWKFYDENGKLRKTEIFDD